MIPAAIVYILAAVCFIWLGIGSIMARRWARDVILTISWLWLVSGILTLICSLFVIPEMFSDMAETGQIPQNAVTFLKIFMISFMAFFFAVIPGVLVLFYSGRNVKATSETRDPVTRWTDKCPLPVLALSFIYGFGAIFALTSCFYGGVVPFFGTILIGYPGTLVLIGSGLLLGLFCIGICKMDFRALWGSVAFILVSGISTLWTFSQMGLIEFYEKSQLMSPRQLEMMRQYSFMDSSDMVFFTGIWFAIILGYTLYTKRYFKTIRA